jgi:hypothetical protein
MLVFPPLARGMYLKLHLQKYFLRVRQLEKFAKTFLHLNLLVKTNKTNINVDQHAVRKVHLTTSLAIC